MEISHELIYCKGKEAYSFVYTGTEYFNNGEFYEKLTYKTLEYENNGIEDVSNKIEKI